MWASYIMDGRIKPLYENRYAQVLSNGTFFSEIYPMARNADSGISLKTFITKLGLPERLTIYVSKDKNAPDT